MAWYWWLLGGTVIGAVLVYIVLIRAFMKVRW